MNVYKKFLCFRFSHAKNKFCSQNFSFRWLAKNRSISKKKFDPFLAGKARAMKYFHDPFYNC